MEYKGSRPLLDEVTAECAHLARVGRPLIIGLWGNSSLILWLSTSTGRQKLTDFALKTKCVFSEYASTAFHFKRFHLSPLVNDSFLQRQPTSL
jgi:hypothetical protein